jgi:hypothetical protein
MGYNGQLWDDHYPDAGFFHDHLVDSDAVKQQSAEIGVAYPGISALYRIQAAACGADAGRGWKQVT